MSAELREAVADDLTGQILAALIAQHGNGIWATELSFDGGACDG